MVPHIQSYVQIKYIKNDERYQFDATILFIIINNSTCFRYLYAYLQEYIVRHKLTHSAQDYTLAPQDLSHNT